MPLALMRRFRSQPKAWDFAQFVLFRAFSAATLSGVPWTELVSQVASQDGYPRRLKMTLAQVIGEIRPVYRDFPVEFLPGLRGSGSSRAAEGVGVGGVRRPVDDLSARPGRDRPGEAP